MQIIENYAGDMQIIENSSRDKQIIEIVPDICR